MSENESGSIGARPNGRVSRRISGPKIRGMDEGEAEHREHDQRRQRCVDVVHPGEARDEDDDARDRREDGLDQDRREDRPVARLARQLRQRRDACGRRPDAAGHVLGEHRDHLGLQRRHVRDLHVPLAEDPHPAEDEDEVVGGDRREREPDVAEVRVPQLRPRLRPLAAHAPDAQPDDGERDGDLDRAQQVRPPPEGGEQVARSVQHSLHPRIVRENGRLPRVTVRGCRFATSRRS